MMKYFRDQGFRWMAKPSQFPDYHPHIEGAVHHGRTLDPAVFDAASLGHYQKYLPKPDGAPVIPRFEDFRVLTSFGSSKGNVEACVDGSIADRSAPQGARVQRRGSDESVDIHASLGVILTTGGFSQNQEMRDAYLAGTATSETTSGMPTKAEWSLASDGDAGIALRAGQRIGAGSAQLGQVWGIPTMIDPRTGKVTEAMFAISKPFSIVVDGCGRRFFSESQPYGEAVRSMYERANEDEKRPPSGLCLTGDTEEDIPLGASRAPGRLTRLSNKACSCARTLLTA
ncbi:uncharacterized protein BKA55DRAFT_545624 [Fusarium redolens]|uniref:FAD-dependent oxidoreductase 2 FAD-binding domain-containing protein n=1 Tax=Fusarium redolens TaxID=48865 RepID=A0A9P9G0Q5_FUSRE|nr:uncharacterized protein BKA55DRAFT_545624 [Fusarium redolens]KAH7228539.1 hypothetical protein BKA55DRAFT_545624 [Fusarium redolens]